MRSCMRLPALTTEEIETIDAIIKEGTFDKITATVDDHRAEQVNPYGLNATDRSRMQLLNDALYDDRHELPTTTARKVRFAENMTESFGEHVRLSTRYSDSNILLSEANMTEKNRVENEDENCIVVKAHRIVNYAFGIHDK